MRRFMFLFSFVVLISGTGNVAAQSLLWTTTECDRLTANQYDPDSPLSHFGYVAYNEIDAKKAVVTCLKDLEAYPTKNARLKLNLGRAYNKLGDFEKSFWYTKQAADAKYRYAYHVMALHYNYGEGVEKNADLEVRYLNLAAKNKVPISHHRLGKLELDTGLQADLVKVEGHIEFARRRGMDTTLAFARLNYGKAKLILINQLISIRTDEEPVIIAASLNPMDLRLYKNYLVSARDLFRDYLKLYPNNKYRSDLERIEQLLAHRITDKEIVDKIERLQKK